MGSKRYEISEAAVAGEPGLLYISSSQYDGTWHSIMHTHGNAELFYCVGGVGRFRVQDEVIPVQADDIILVNPYVEHTEYSLEGLEYIVLGVEGVEFLSPDGAGVRFRSFNYTENRRELLPYFRDLVFEAERRHDQYQEVCREILRILFVKMHRHTLFDLTCAPVRATSKECVEVKRYIEENFRQNLSLDLLAERTHLSKFYLAHSFRKEFGISPMAYLMECRLKESRYLLEHTDHQLADISNMTGFSSPSYFSQCFRNAQGISPIAHRRANRKREAAAK